MRLSPMDYIHFYTLQAVMPNIKAGYGVDELMGCHTEHLRC